MVLLGAPWVLLRASESLQGSISASKVRFEPPVSTPRLLLGTLRVLLDAPWVLMGASERLQGSMRDGPTKATPLANTYLLHMQAY